ncbi:MAG: substrate-binding domain-containing protein [Desulfobacterales bacterium]
MNGLRKVFFGFFSIGLLSVLISSFSFAGSSVLLMATTTSTENTGLLDYLAPHYTRATGVELKWTAVGTGKAFELGKRCDVDVLLVHAPEAEEKYVADGYGVNRRRIMFNDFILIGPASDPAGIKGKNAIEALTGIRERKLPFVSRGDDSGTNKKEILLWKESGSAVPDRESWYVQTGQGMLSTIHIAAERNAYTMTDRGTYIKYEDNRGGNPELKILAEGDALLKNQYSVIAINKSRCPNVRYDSAMKFSDWMAGQEAQRLIGEFMILGKPLFTPNAN